MAFDTTDLNALNRHFKSLSELRKVLVFMPPKLLLAVTLAMLKNSDHSRLNGAYEKICEDIDDGKPLTFASVQTVCASRLKRRDKSARTRNAVDTPDTLPAKSYAGSTTGTAKNKWIKKGLAPETAVFAAMLDRNGVSPKEVLRECVIQSYQDDRVLSALSTACALISRDCTRLMTFPEPTGKLLCLGAHRGFPHGKAAVSLLSH